MIVLILFAFISGIVTILSPCILPVLPVVLSGSLGKGEGRARSLGVVAGFIVSFTFFTLALTAIVQAFGIPGDALRIAAVIVIVLFGAVLVVPKLSEWFERIIYRIAALARFQSKIAGNTSETRAPSVNGFGAGFLLGMSLGLIWTPCVGPIMASIITLAVSQHIDVGAVFITLAYSFGTAIPMFAIMIGGRALLKKVPVLTRNTLTIQRVFGVLMIIVGIAIAFGWDRQFQSGVLALFPGYGSGLTSIENTTSVRNALSIRKDMGFDNRKAPGRFIQVPPPGNGRLGRFGKAPEIVTQGRLYNADKIFPKSTSDQYPLDMKALDGKVVLVDFWTYSCVNCVRTIPYLRSWYEKYSLYGLVILGVNSPEFEFEKNQDNVAKAIRDLAIEWPVVLDNDYAEWNAYSNVYWPADYFIDGKGEVRYFQFGEGDYDIAERVIRALLKENGASLPAEKSTNEYMVDSNTPEMYLGYSRMAKFLSASKFVTDHEVDYSIERSPKNGEWGLSGTWTITREYVVPKSEGTLLLGFDAKSVFCVIEPESGPMEIEIKVDGKIPGDTPDVKGGRLVPDTSRLYQIVGLKSPGTHMVELRVKGKIRLYAFTFG
jgi:cytochrome c biogenesis protein CcdA/thiol-disulfide isomerase/thioredoxin